MRMTPLSQQITHYLYSSMSSEYRYMGCVHPLLSSPQLAGQHRAVFTRQLWQNGEEITYHFLDGAENQRHKVGDVIKDWEECANITFKRVNSLPATVCITFTGPHPYSTPVTDGETTGKSNLTICLSGTANDNILAPTEKGNILHEFGHILGLGHEHLSPDMKHKYRLKAAAVKELYMAKYGWPEADVIANILEPYEREATTNYSKLDPKSIMMYPISATMNKENVDIPPNHDLSEIDKAYMAINYPRDLSSVLKALHIIDLDSQAKLNILEAHEAHDILEMRRLLAMSGLSSSHHSHFRNHLIHWTAKVHFNKQENFSMF